VSVRAERIEVARAVDILATAQRFVVLKRVGLSSPEYFGPCPACGGKDRFGVNVKKQVWNCRGCDKGGDSIDLVRHALDVGFAEAVADLAGEERRPPERESRRSNRPPGDEDYERRQREKARWLWAQRRPLEGSIGEKYLRQARAYRGPLPATLGFLKPLRPEHHPALIAAFSIPEEIEPGVLASPANVNSVLLVRLKPDGSGKADVGEDERQKITVGPHPGVPVVVAPVNDLLGLAIAEGLEDAVTAAAIGLGAWAAGGASFMPKLADAVPSYVECVTIFAHPDDGLKFARELERLLLDRGFEVRFDDGQA
jgi:putative DNA primase/helicase